MTTARKRPTALDKAKQRIEELEDDLRRERSGRETDRAERRRLEERCAWLYQEAEAHGAEAVRLRLAAGFMSESSIANARTLGDVLAQTVVTQQAPLPKTMGHAQYEPRERR